MYLYNLTLQKPTSIFHAISGSFTAPKKEEILISSGTSLELLSINPLTSKLQPLISKETFSQIRSISAFRLAGNKRDSIIVLSDSGKIVILEADLSKETFVKVHQETYGKTGCRRIVPSEYIACDPTGRAIMIGAIEKQKFVYILTRDSNGAMTISSPLEAHKSKTICYGMCSVNDHYENPQFVCIEVEYGDEDNEKSAVCTGVYQKVIVYYEMDLSLNHVVRKSSEKVDNSAHLIVGIPKNKQLPGGVLVFCEDFVVYRNNNGAVGTKTALYPQRYDNVYTQHKKKVMIVCTTVFKKKEMFFVLAQSEFGDLYKVLLNFDKGKILSISVSYFDTVPPCNAIILLHSGYLFCACETSNHLLYAITSFENINENHISTSSGHNAVLFHPSYPHKHITLIHEMNSFACVTQMVVSDVLNEGEPQLYITSGQSQRSNLRLLRPGLSVNELGSSLLKGDPSGIWSIKGSAHDEYDQYIVVSFINATVVLGVSDSISEITHSCFDVRNSTIYVALIGNDKYVQVISEGIIHIAKGKKSFLKSNSKVKCACSNSKQLIIGLENKEMLYFEHDGNELCKPDIKVLDQDIICVDISPVMEGRTKSKFVVAGCGDNTIRIFSLEIEQCLSKVSFQILPYQISSLCFVSYCNDSNVYLYVGLANGVLVKTVIDGVTGNQMDMQAKYMGLTKVKLYKIVHQGNECLVACSSKAYLCYKYMGKYYSDVFYNDTIECVTHFNSKNIYDGIIVIKDNMLRILQIDNFDIKFTQSKTNLRYTPRAVINNQHNKTLIIIESDQHCYSNYEKEKFRATVSTQTNSDSNVSTAAYEDIIGVPYTADGNWASCIRIVDANTLDTVDLIEFEGSEAAFSAQLCTFASFPGEKFLIVGTAVNVKMLPHLTFSNAYLVVFVLKENETKIEFVFKQSVNDIVRALCEYQGRLLAGVGNSLVLYDMGKSHLLKKCECKKITSAITKIQTNGQRILLSTINESFYFLRHKTNENQFYIFADDVIPRWLTASIFIDYDTIAGADKFENFFIYRLPQGADEENKNDPMSSQKKWEVGYLHGAAYKLNLLAQYHVGDLITALCKTSLKGGDDNIVCYCTSSGRIGVFMPFETRDEVDFFIHLEMYLRIEIDNVVGREHQMFRSCYGPVKCVIDGDLCEEYFSMDGDKQKQLAKDLDKNKNEVLNSLLDIRNKII